MKYCLAMSMCSSRDCYSQESRREKAVAINPIELHLTTTGSDGKVKGVEFARLDNLINVNVVPRDQILNIHIFNRQSEGGVKIRPIFQTESGKSRFDNSCPSGWILPQQSLIISSHPAGAAPFLTSDFLHEGWLSGPGGGIKVSFEYEGRPSRWTRLLWMLTEPFEYSWILRLATQDQLDRYCRERCLTVTGRSIWTPEGGVVQLLR